MKVKLSWAACILSDSPATGLLECLPNVAAGFPQSI